METTQGKSATSDVIRQVRRKVEDARAELFVALGDSYLARQEPARAVHYLEQALDRSPIAPLLARKLADACAQSGQGGYANQVRLRYGLEQADKMPAISGVEGCWRSPAGGTTAAAEIGGERVTPRCRPITLT